MQNETKNLPEADAAGVYVDEAGLRIVADAAGLLRQGGAAQLREAAAGDANIDRLALDMEAVDRDAFAVSVKHRIRQGRAVPGNHLEGFRGAQPMLDSRQQVEQRGIDRLDFVRAEIAQDVVDAIQLFGDVLSVFPVSRLQTLAGVQRIELERAASKLNCGACEGNSGDCDLRSGNRANLEEAPSR